MRLRRLTKKSLEKDIVASELGQARCRHVPTFTHFLDIPILPVIVSLGAMQPDAWMQFVMGTATAIAVATLLTVTLPRLYPWTPPVLNAPRNG